MKKTKLLEKINNQNGVSAVMTLLITAVVLTISLSISALMISEIKMVGAYDDSVIAYYAADAGIEDALLKTKNEEQIPTEGYSNSTAPIFTVKQKTGSNQAVGDLAQDQSTELDMKSNNRPNKVYIEWNDTGKLSEGSSAGTSRCAIEWTLIAYQTDASGISLPPGSNIGKGYYNGNGNAGGYNISCPSGYCSETKSITLGSPNQIIISLNSNLKYSYKLRFKCLASTESGYSDSDSYSLSYAIAGDNGYVNANAVTLGSTGTSNDVKRRVTVDINNPKELNGIFDYVLYSEDKVDKPGS